MPLISRRCLQELLGRSCDRCGRRQGRSSPPGRRRPHLPIGQRNTAVWRTEDHVACGRQLCRYGRPPVKDCGAVRSAGRGMGKAGSAGSCCCIAVRAWPIHLARALRSTTVILALAASSVAGLVSRAVVTRTPTRPGCSCEIVPFSWRTTPTGTAAVTLLHWTAIFRPDASVDRMSAPPSPGPPTMRTRPGLSDPRRAGFSPGPGRGARRSAGCTGSMQLPGGAACGLRRPCG
jgi:hypothetical protein